LLEPAFVPRVGLPWHPAGPERKTAPDYRSNPVRRYKASLFLLAHFNANTGAPKTVPKMRGFLANALTQVLCIARRHS
jgi:hypothetical protein